MHPLSRRIGEVLELDPEARAIEYEGVWFGWDQLGALSRQIAATVQPGAQVGILLRNTPAHVATLLGVLSAGACVVVINPSRGDERIRADIAALNLPVIIGTADDITQLAEPADTTTVVTIGNLDDIPQIRAGVPRYPGVATVAVRMLTSGTTGPPKRVDLTYDMLAVSVIGTDFTDTPAPSGVSGSVAIVNAPLVHIGGVYRVLQCVCEARPFVLLPRFELTSWAEAVRRYRPKAVSLVPAALRMVLHSDLGPDDLDGVRAVTSGTAPLSAEDADAFTEKFGIPVLTSYAATEFGGGVAGWTFADHRTYWKSKRGSVGRASLGAQLRVVSEDGTPLEPDEQGLLEVKPGQLGRDADWVRTTDLARIDADGFLWILGRADQAIIRGGFKVLPDDVRAALESHPAVLGAAVVGRPDERLGDTPVAMVELRDSGSVGDIELADYLRSRLAPYEIPSEIAIVETIPRTPSGKADLTAVRQHFSGRDR
ncbi:acyl-CoA synthetase (AMP-forming)/AMP-acid ligase II [Mycolicibacterium sp. BK556]|uniref:class I adenylate-forming enzyme family protein n=1 Tax=unclassified Mycolicibacterium TaxID=2636767 RepID=UPI00160A3B05|nr:MULTISPECIES: AMP-binding protein [unclassified Mycolicibacterium]MBB3601863.1 acyl-CoA synthetase (AMP-forming)/AMP-acid ligase II [Mycolicibacterium sp. BK556]MBB3631615.1 acyl-CoA synthetase (AMP-forming)/AMP-acid ligase II [Mycolicibacterium sp. BK607]MBB3749619.1 acyl-CoA synthetase (AMP-forming)/AMP-acid ligase II [Mycolicibacterium sp. BK634]